jgi:hypothetical protein
MRRFRTLPGDFDARCYGLEPVQDQWEDQVKELHIENQARTIEGLKAEFGMWNFERKMADFIAIGVKPFSVQSYHNAFFDQARRAFVQGAYYPALIGACALGERILNHLVLDLRDDFSHTPEYADVASDTTFSNWRRMLVALSAWDVIDPDVAALFRTLSGLRHRSVHFNPKTYDSAREDALNAITTLRDILQKQFSAFGPQRWFMPGTPGVCFIAKDYEENPFVKRFITPSAVYVGPLHNIRITDGGGWQFVDWPPDVYGDGEISDEQYRQVFNERTPESLVPLDGPHVPATILGPDDVQRP